MKSWIGNCRRCMKTHSQQIGPLPAQCFQSTYLYYVSWISNLRNSWVTCSVKILSSPLIQLLPEPILSIFPSGKADHLYFGGNWFSPGLAMHDEFCIHVVYKVAFRANVRMEFLHNHIIPTLSNPYLTITVTINVLRHQHRTIICEHIALFKMCPNKALHSII